MSFMAMGVGSWFLPMSWSPLHLSLFVNPVSWVWMGAGAELKASVLPLAGVVLESWVLPIFVSPARELISDDPVPWVRLGAGAELEASVLPWEEIEVTEDTESECSVSVSSLVWLMTVDWSSLTP